jgi:hypothetical protein
MGDEPNLNPRIIDDFFMSKIVMLNPNLVTETGFECFFRFFKAVNCKSNKVGPESRLVYFSIFTFYMPIHRDLD